MIRAFHSVATTMDRTERVEHLWGVVAGRLCLELRWRTAAGARLDRERREFNELYDQAVAAANADVVAWALEDHQDGDWDSRLDLLRTIIAGQYDEAGGER